jgi:hypothetical protein
MNMQFHSFHHAELPALVTPHAWSLSRLCALLTALTLSFTKAQAQDGGVTVLPPVSVVERPGITGAGWAVVAGDAKSKRVILTYPNHPDDFGGSAGTGTVISENGGQTWKPGPDDWSIAKTVDLWMDRIGDGSLVAFGIRWLPDPAKRGQQTAAEVPADAFAIATSKDGGRTWNTENARIECPPELGIIARPLPHIIEDGKGAWLMPAYAWSKGGNRALLLRSENRGRDWRVLSTIATAENIRQSGAPLTTPWLETAVARAADGALLAVMRTGSSEKAALVSCRSSDGGRTWTRVEKLLTGPSREEVAGKVPNLVLLSGGPLVLLTAHTKLGCRLYFSTDGNGLEWSEAQVVTKLSGGNTSLVALDPKTLLIFTPSSKRISCWKITLPGVSK